MKKSTPANVVGLVFVALFFVAFSYLLWKTWDIFGFWRIVGTAFINMFANVFLLNFLGSGRREEGDVVTYNPKELPKFVGLFILLGVGYYLFDYLNGVPDLSGYDRTLGLLYLGLLTFVPAAHLLYRLIRDRNDYISVSTESVWYKDNATEERFALASISNAVISSKRGIVLSFVDGTDHGIPTKEMNFNTRDVLGVLGEILKQIPDANMSEENQAMREGTIKAAEFVASEDESDASADDDEAPA
jgi:hypothetical protein